VRSRGKRRDEELLAARERDEPGLASGEQLAGSLDHLSVSRALAIDKALLADSRASHLDGQGDRLLRAHGLGDWRDERRVERVDEDVNRAAARESDIEASSSAIPYFTSLGGPPARTACASS
jgi:hypothetical protein